MREMAKAKFFIRKPASLDLEESAIHLHDTRKERLRKEGDIRCSYGA
jgi:hypothetical protein